MDRQRSRKIYENRKYTFSDLDFSSNGKDSCNEKTKCKRFNNRKCKMRPNSYSVKWSPQPRFHSIAQRPFSTSESSACHYSVPLSFSFEPISLPIYSALIQPPGSCAVPLEIDKHFNKSKHHRKHKTRQSKANSVDHNEPPAMFATSRLNNGDQQDYTSLPPVNCDNYPSKSNDIEAVCKRRFSDPGIGQMSSDECSSSRSDDESDSSGSGEIQSNNFFIFVEQVNKLKESNTHLKKELNETKAELESLKMQSLIWRTGVEDFKPGVLSDAISEIRNAVKLSEETLVLKVVQMLEKNCSESKEAQEKFEEKLRKEVDERLTKLEEQLNESSFRERKSETRGTETEPILEKSDIQQQLMELEREKFQLRKELQEAVSKRKTAEATTEKLERLVGILRKKVNGVSLESCLPDEKQILVRPLASSLEKNPFIIANNRQGQKSDTFPLMKSRIPPFRAFPLETTEINVVLNDNKENEIDSAGNSNDSSQSPPSDTPSVGVTITGPVTDL